jgi:transposase-like protein
MADAPPLSNADLLAMLDKHNETRDWSRTYRNYKNIDRVQVLKDWESMSLADFARKYGRIPENTLRDWKKAVRQGKPLQNPGRPTVLPRDKEERLYEVVVQARKGSKGVDLEGLQILGRALLGAQSVGRRCINAGWARCAMHPSICLHCLPAISKWCSCALCG